MKCVPPLSSEMRQGDDSQRAVSSANTVSFGTGALPGPETVTISAPFPPEPSASPFGRVTSTIEITRPSNPPTNTASIAIWPVRRGAATDIGGKLGIVPRPSATPDVLETGSISGWLGEGPNAPSGLDWGRRLGALLRGAGG